MDDLITGAAHDPHALLGAHPAGGRTVIRTLRRGASKVAVVVGDTRVDDARARRGRLRGDRAGGGARLPARRGRPGRRRPVPAPADARRPRPAPDRRGPARATVDGARRASRARAASRSPSGRPTRRACGWSATSPAGAPHDGWPMRSLGSSGVWEVFVPEASVGHRYKYRILGRDGSWRDKSDPMAQRTRGAAAHRLGGPPVRLRVERRRLARPARRLRSRTGSR